MGLLKNVRKILAQDYADENRTLIAKLSEVLNTFMTETTETINGNIDFDNLRQQLKVFKVTVDGSGTITSSNQIRLELSGKVIGIRCERARNLDDSSVYPTGTPFLSYSQTNQILKINNISNLQSGNEYELTIVIQYDNR
jgi:hypothetical protein